jgi:hypothetical protein
MQTFVPGIPFYLNMPANATYIYDSLRLGKRIKELRTIYFCGFQSERKEGGICCPQGGLTIEPKGVFHIDNAEEGSDVICFWGKCVSFTPHVGDNKEKVTVTGYASGRINLFHGSGFFLFSETPLGLEQISKIKDPALEKEGSEENMLVAGANE